MDEKKTSQWITTLVIVLCVANVLALLLGYRAMSLARQGQSGSPALAQLQEQVDLLNKELADMRSKVDKKFEQLARNNWAMHPPMLREGHLPPRQMGDLRGPKGPPGGPPGSGPEAGPADIPQPEALNPEQVATYRKNLIERNGKLHQADQERYGNQLAALYAAARANSGPTGSNSESDTALSQLRSQYPDANATGMVIGEKALQAAGQANTLAVEQYYSMLMENQNFSSIVIDSGVEVVPSIQSYLAYQYLQQGQTAKAEAVLQSLESSYGQGMVAVPGPSGNPEFRPVSEVVNGMRTQLGSTR